VAGGRGDNLSDPSEESALGEPPGKQPTSHVYYDYMLGSASVSLDLDGLLPSIRRK
jgi:hypothetical protein